MDVEPVTDGDFGIPRYLEHNKIAIKYLYASAADSGKEWEPLGTIHSLC